MKDFYFNENDARYFISTHTYEEIKQEIDNTEKEAKKILDAWSCLNNAEEIVNNERYNRLLPDRSDDPYFQTKCLLSSLYVELRKYIEFLENNIKENN